ncbi:single-stranded DNA-binding protein [Nesterenkonia populi]|uniref:single-stranded DNA-binding protein n=1 Tax=Nesterenkonia populi TaxID=1591087 RepID=UPI0011BF26FC|nr:single-stranded DNA-binding protein [Nesterenkonia populi]
MADTITVRGNAGTAPQEPAGESGFTSFRLASTFSVFSSGQWQERNTTWYTVKCWQRLASHVHASMSKGDPVVVTGRPQLRTWQADDGKTGQELEIFAETIGHDLARGTSSFTKAHPHRDQSANAQTEAPPADSDWDAAHQQQEAPPF